MARTRGKRKKSETPPPPTTPLPTGDNDEETTATSGPPQKKGSRKTSAAKTTEKAPKKTQKEAAVERRERIQTYKDEGKLRDSTGNPTGTSDRQWIEILATHLACEQKFIGFMQNPQPFEHVVMNGEWMAAVYLPGRYNRYADFEKWQINWARKHKSDIIEQAADLVKAASSRDQTSIEGTLADLPKNDQATQDRREALFKVQNTRQKLLLTAKRLTDVQYRLAKTLVLRIGEDVDTDSAVAMYPVIKEFTLLDCVKDSIKEQLAQSSLNKRGVSILDTLLGSVPASEEFGMLYILNGEQDFPIVTELGAATDTLWTEEESEPAKVDLEAISNKIQTTAGVKIDFLGGKTLNDVKVHNDVFGIKSTKRSCFDEIQVLQPIRGHTLLDGPEMATFDQESSEWLEEMAETFDAERFMLNFRDFEKIVDRPEVCAKTPKKSHFWGARANSLVIARDNIAHFRRLVAELTDNGMIEKFPEDDDVADKLQLVLRRMYALLAVMHGCCAEGAILLTVMDHLLEELGSLVIGSLDPKLESVRMQDATAALHSSHRTAKRRLHMNDLQRMDREHKAREVFAEVARFYRGAVVMVFVAASYRKSNKTEIELWYKGLVKHIPRLETSSRPETWSVSVAVKDARMGFPAERSTVSANRATAYGCFYELVAFTRFHVGLVPFFHYFAHLWHPACRPFRGKSSLVDDITMIEKQSAVELPTLAVEAMDVDDLPVA